jgi:hypothetical protein
MAINPFDKIDKRPQSVNCDLLLCQLHISESAYSHHNVEHRRANASQTAPGILRSRVGDPLCYPVDGMRFGQCSPSKTPSRVTEPGPAEISIGTATCRSGPPPRHPQPRGNRRAGFPDPRTVQTATHDPASKTENFSPTATRKHLLRRGARTAEFSPSPPRNDPPARRHSELDPR